MLILIAFLLNNCENVKVVAPPIPKQLLIPEKEPKPPKIKAKIPKSVALYIIDLREAFSVNFTKIVTISDMIREIQNVK